MKKNELVIDGRYLMKVSGKVVPVKVIKEYGEDKWLVVNEKTNRHICIKSARRLRCPADEATRRSIAEWARQG